MQDKDYFVLEDSKLKRELADIHGFGDEYFDKVDELKQNALRALEHYIATNFKKIPRGSHDVTFTFVDGGLRRPVLPKQDQVYVRRLLKVILYDCPTDKVYSLIVHMEGAKIVAKTRPSYDEHGDTILWCD